MTRCAPAMLGSPQWAVFCRHCKVTVSLWHEDYPTIEAVRAFWNASVAQGELFATEKRSHSIRQQQPWSPSEGRPRARGVIW